MPDAPMPRIACLQVGPLQTNCYLVAAQEPGPCAVIDPGGDAQRICEELHRRGLTPEAFLVTHSHYDHVGALAQLADRFPDAVVAAHATCAEHMGRSEGGLSGPTGPAQAGGAVTRVLEHGDTVDAGGCRFAVLHTPGHAPGLAAYLVRESGLLFCGDLLFRDSAGRTDLPGGSRQALAQSLRDHVLCLPDETRVLPGHGPPTTVGRERRENPVLRELVG